MFTANCRLRHLWPHIRVICDSHHATETRREDFGQQDQETMTSSSCLPITNPGKIMPADQLMRVLTFMSISIASPQLPRPYKAGRMPWSLYELVKALRTAPVGSWLSVKLAALPGSTPAAKQSSTARTARRQFNPIQTQMKGSRLFVRRLPDLGSCPGWPQK
jgi:hypothetical protein